MVRVTSEVAAVVEALRQDEPLWGYRVCQVIERGPGTVYPILKRLEEAGWARTWMETDPPPDRPARRYYALTSHGLAQYVTVLAARQARRPWWRRR